MYTPGECLKVETKQIDIEDNKFELSTKDFTKSSFNNIRKFITEYGEYIGKE